MYHVFYILPVSEQDVVELEKRYWAIKALSKTGRFDLTTFTLHVSPPLPGTLCQGMLKICFSLFEKEL